MIKPRIFVLFTMLTSAALMSQQALGQVVFGSTGGDDSFSVAQDAEYLVGHKIHVSEEAILTHVGIVFDGQGGKCKIGIYTDSGNQPEHLLGEIHEFSICRGPIEAPIADPLVLSPGDYWVAIVCNRDTKISRSRSPDVKTCYRPLSFAASMPDPIGPTTNYTRSATENVYLKCEYPKEGICPFSTAPAGEIYFPTIKGKVYQVQFTENLESPNWQPLAPPFTATGAKTNVFVSTRNTPKRRYRVIIK